VSLSARGSRVAKFWQRRTLEGFVEAIDLVVSDYGYVPLRSPVEGTIRHRFSVVEGQEAYATLLAARSERVREFEKLMTAAQIDLSAEAWLSEVESWCHQNARVRSDDEDFLTPVWTSIANDIALYWGERVVALAPGVLRWELDVTPRAATYLHPLLRGFPKEPDAVLAPEYSPSYLVTLNCCGFATGTTMSMAVSWQRSHDWMVLCLRDVIDSCGS
jgi:hypothetical protein